MASIKDPPPNMPVQVLTRPFSAEGTFWRIITINDVYKLPNYTRVASAVKAAKAAAAELDCVVTSHLSGDFMSPSTHTALDGGCTLIQALNHGKIDICSLGNHEYDVGTEHQACKLREFKGTLLNSNVDDQHLQEFPKYKIIDIGDRKAVLGGYLTGEKSVYKPSSMPVKLRPINEACVSTWGEAKKHLNGVIPHLFLPMTHQLLHQDRNTAEYLCKHEELRDRTPIILGGHEHDLYVEEAGNSIIVKMGEDAQLIGVIDIWWTKNDEIKSQINVIPACEFPVDQDADAWVTKKEADLQVTMSVPIATLPFACTSTTTRVEESKLASFLCSKMKQAYRADTVELVFLIGGGVRAMQTYEKGHPFTMGDLFNELPFDDKLWFTDVPGHIIAESIAATREAPKPNPSFIQLDLDCSVEVQDGKHVLTQVDGKPFQRDKTYRVCTVLTIFAGLGDIEPLVSWISDNVQEIASEEVCDPYRDVVISTCMKEAWRSLVGFHAFDKDENGDISHEDLVAGIEKFVSEIDKNNDGHIDQAELEELMAKGKGDFGGSDLVAKMISTLDVDGNGSINKDELLALAF
jgi:2',3'-cyclic-nucleotide 2'-phosphodiesterase (5'-nucleotidase family)